MSVAAIATGALVHVVVHSPVCMGAPNRPAWRGACAVTWRLRPPRNLCLELWEPDRARFAGRVRSYPRAARPSPAGAKRSGCEAKALQMDGDRPGRRAPTDRAGLRW